jgi:hypothetical protein
LYAPACHWLGWSSADLYIGIENAAKGYTKGSLNSKTEHNDKYDSGKAAL